MHGVRCFDRTAERRPPLSRPALMLLCLSPRLFTRTDTTTASPRRAASISFLYRAPPTLSSAHRLVAISASLRLIPLRSASLRFAPNREQPSALGRSEDHASTTVASGSVAAVSSAGLALFTIRVLLDLDISRDVPQHAGPATRPTSVGLAPTARPPPRTPGGRAGRGFLSVEGRPRACLCRLY